MIDIKFKKCCENCPTILVDYSETIVDGCNTYTRIECAYHEVCEEYREQSEDMRIVKP